MRLFHESRIWALQGGLSRNKVAVGESAAGSPPTDRDAVDHTTAPIHCGVPTWELHEVEEAPRSPIRHLGH